MELRILKYFLLMQLEDELGVKLFYRSKHRITLTDEGLLLKRRAQEITELAERTTREVSRSSENLMGEIAIGCAEASSISVLAGLMNYFRQKYPLVHYTLYSGIAEIISVRNIRWCIIRFIPALPTILKNALKTGFWI